MAVVVASGGTTFNLNQLTSEGVLILHILNKYASLKLLNRIHFYIAWVCSKKKMAKIINDTSCIKKIHK